MIRPIALYLPQFHPVPENDAFWGRGFTEWTNTSRAKPLFKGHYQPHIPADLGYYDLRLEETRIAQAELAREYGIYGFCYYHYWFNGRRPLGQPIDAVLASGKPDFPFMICWANENWTRRWDGQDREILLQQNYNAEDDQAHIAFLCRHFFSDPRYIRVNGKPFLAIYRPSLIPDLKNTIRTWRAYAESQGMELHIGFMRSFELEGDFRDHGLDAAIEFHPSFSKMFAAAADYPLKDRILHTLGISHSVYYTGKVISYPKYAGLMIREQTIAPDTYPGITPMWDNTARNKDRALIFRDSDPVTYGQWLESLLGKYKVLPGDEKFLFINAWNEWAEGNHLEPCLKWGRQYLEITRAALQKTAG